MRRPRPGRARPAGGAVRRGVTVLLLGGALAGCSGDGDGPQRDPAGRAGGGGDAVAPGDRGPGGVEAGVAVLRDGVEAAPGTRVLPPGAGETGSGWYAALDLDGADPDRVAGFYREHLAALGFTVSSGTTPLTVLGTRPDGPTTRVRVDVVPTAGEVPGFVRLVARS